MAARTDGVISGLARGLGASGEIVQRLQRVVGALMVSRTQQAFEDQRRGGSAWLGRAPVNRIGILRDLEAGRGIPARRFETRPAGLDTGSLRASIAWEPIPRGVRFGTQLPYGQDFQQGGEVRIAIGGTLRRRLKQAIGRARGARQNLLAAAFAGPLRAGELVATVPPRPFVLTTQQDLEDVGRLVEREVRRALGSGGA